MTQHNLDHQTAITPPPDRRPAGTLRRSVRRIPLWAFLAVGGLVLVAAVVLSLQQAGTTNDATDSASVANGHAAAVKSEAAPLAGQVQSVCAQGGAAASQLAKAGACTQAQKVISVVQQPVRGPAGKQGPGPSDSQVQAFVDQYFAIHPLPAGQLPPVSEVAGLVASYLQAHPPANGQDATPTMVANQVSDYCAAHDGCGTGDVASAVAAYCAQPTSPCQGPPGKDGADGQPGTNGTNGTDGQPGATGQQGPPPATYTVQVPGLTGSTTETCTRTNTDDTAPDYACS